MNLGMRNRVAIVTGSSRGIRKAIARASRYKETSIVRKAWLTDILHVEQTIAYEVAFNIEYYIPDIVV